MKIVLPAYRADSVHRGGQQKGLVRVEEHPHEPHPRADGLEAHDSEFVSHQVEGRQSASDKSHDGDALVFIEPFAIPSNLIPSRPKNLAEHLGVADLCGGQRGRAVLESGNSIAIRRFVVLRTTVRERQGDARNRPSHFIDDPDREAVERLWRR
jgi:hypothetical protein